MQKEHDRSLFVKRGVEVLRKGDATRVRILDEAARQAARRGLAGVSLADVGEAISLSKSGLFKHFDSKEAMHLAVVEQVSARFTEFVWQTVEALPPGRARLEAMFARWLDWIGGEWSESGCPMLALSVELDDQPGPTRELLAKQLNRWRKTLVREFKALCDPPMSDAAAEACAFQAKSFALGYVDAERMLGVPEARRMADEAFASLLDRACPK
jgi:AcrR family transcriptional regulator